MKKQSLPKLRKPARQPRNVSARGQRGRKIRGRVAATLGGLGLAAPSYVYQLVLYRQNLASAREPLPLAPAFTARDRLLVLSPHLDDETLGVGGTLAAAHAIGAATRVVFLTNGDASVSTKIGEDARNLRRHSMAQIVRIRQQEALAALQVLGVAESEVLFLGYPDGGTKAMWEVNWAADDLYRSPYTGRSRSPYANSLTREAPYCGEQALSDIRRVIEEWQPTAIFTTHPSDTHPDHWAAYAFVDAALQSLRLDPATRDWAGRTQLLTFLVHRGLWPAPHGYHPSAPLSPPANLRHGGTQWRHLPLDDRARRAKAAALNCYESQLTFTPQYLRSFLRCNELMGSLPVVEIGTGVTRVKQTLSRTEVPAADIKEVELVESQADRLTLRFTMTAAPAARLSYRLAVHGGDAAIRVYNLTIRTRRQQPRAMLTNASSANPAPRELAIRRLANGLEVDIPRAALGVDDERKLIVAAASFADHTTPEQTETGTVHLAAAPDADAPTLASVAAKGRVARRPRLEAAG